MSLSQVRRRPVSLPSGFLLRLVDADLRMVRTASRGAIRGAILATRCLAEPNHGHLLHEVRARRIPFLVDPDTAVLAEVDADNERARWLQAMPAGALVREIPVHPADLDEPGALDNFARAVASTQSGAAALSAGYFRVAGPDDPWRDVNRRLFEATQRLAAGRPVAAWLELPLATLSDRLAADLVGDVRQADLVVLRIAGLRPWVASEGEAVAVLSAVARVRATGVRIILDSVGTLGVPALSAGATAISGAAGHHRSVPVTLVHSRAPQGPRIGWEVALEFRQLSWEEAKAAVASGEVEPCSVAQCRALTTRRRQAAALREHFSHAADADAAWGGAVSLEDVAEQLLACPGPAAQTWGRALSRFAAAATASIHSPR